MANILIESCCLGSFKMNHSKFMKETSVIIRISLSIFIVAGIKYEKIGVKNIQYKKCLKMMNFMDI